jgi:hypothetical protein
MAKLQRKVVMVKFSSSVCPSPPLAKYFQHKRGVNANETIFIGTQQ